MALFLVKELKVTVNWCVKCYYLADKLVLALSAGIEEADNEVVNDLVVLYNFQGQTKLILISLTSKFLFAD